MAEYIERETIKEKMIHYGFKSPDMTVTEFVEDELPAADVAPVVHCKDCKYWKKFNDELRRDGMCEALLNFHGAERYMTNEDFFCSYGERRTDANEPDGT